VTTASAVRLKQRVLLSHVSTVSSRRPKIPVVPQAVRTISVVNVRQHAPATIAELGLCYHQATMMMTMIMMTDARGEVVAAQPHAAKINAARRKRLALISRAGKALSRRLTPGVGLQSANLISVARKKHHAKISHAAVDE